MKYFLFFILVVLALGCWTTRPKGAFDPASVPPPPDYGHTESWAALPDRNDAADLTPPGLEDQQQLAEVDVFFLHPTIYTGAKRSDTGWNGPVHDPSLIERVDSSAIKYQASIFNGAGRIYAPRYRQAHLQAYFMKKREASALRALQLAYEDVKAAFSYYLEHYNQGRPIIIASHSQGTTHAKLLLKDFFVGKTLRNRLVVAYLVGIPVRKDAFADIPVCETPYQTGCFCSWRTWKTGKQPKDSIWTSPDIAVTNPLSWDVQSEQVPRSENIGGVLSNFQKIRPEICNARIAPELGVLWTDRPKTPATLLMLNGNYHVADYNLFYLNVRENASLRVRSFWK